MINGSPHADGCTMRALDEVARTLAGEGIDSLFLQVGSRNLSGCTACGGCYKLGKCVFDDEVNAALEMMQNCDGMVVGSPVYYASANGTLISFLDRLFYASHGAFAYKVGASVVSARRAGTTATFDEINKYFLISNMIIPGSNYWNNVHGNNKTQVEQDIEGLQTMRILGKNIAYILKCQACGVEKPVPEEKTPTNFIR